MFHDLAISTVVVLIAVSPMVFAYWYDRRLEPDADR